MPVIVPNQATANLRKVTIYVTLSDGITPAPASSDWTPQQAATAALTSTHLSGAIVQATAGKAGNATTLTLVSGGAAGITGTSGGAVTATFVASTTTVTALNALLATAGLNLKTGTFTGSNVLASGDASGPFAFSGGADIAFGVRSSGTLQYAAAAGTWASALDFDGSAIDGEWEYTFTQAETNVTGDELLLRFDRTGFVSQVLPLPMQQPVNVGALTSAALQLFWEGTTIEGSYTPGDLMRLFSALLAGTTSDYRTGLIIVKSLDGSKTRVTITAVEGSAGRTAVTVGDLT